MTDITLNGRIIEEVKRMNEKEEIACLKSLHEAIPIVSELTMHRHIDYLIDIKKLYYADIGVGGCLYKTLYAEDPKVSMTKRQAEKIMMKIDKVYEIILLNGRSQDIDEPDT